jgi:hypothetical protein
MKKTSICCPVPLRQLSQSAERFGFFLPRALLDWAEIHARPAPVLRKENDSALEFWRSRRIALVKQTAYDALYSQTGASSWIETALSSACHLGPLALLDELQADYHIVRQASEPETFLWKAKYAHDPVPSASLQKKQLAIDAWESSQAGRTLPSVDDIPWHKYDLVVGLDVPIPARITQKCPRTLWTYLSLEAGGSLQQKSLVRPLDGYDLFLNHGFRRYRCRPANRSHVLEFPLQFQSKRNWEQLSAALPHPPKQKETVLVNRYSRESLDPSSQIPLVLMTGNDPLPEYLAHLFGGLFAVHTTEKNRWGNWAVETVLAGALFLGNKSSLSMLSPLLPGLDVRSLTQAISAANHLAAHPDQLFFLQKLQQELVEEFCFRRPLADLTQKARIFFS